MATEEKDQTQQDDQIQWHDDLDTSALKPPATPKAKTTTSTPAVQWHDTTDTSALEDPERYALTHPEAGRLPEAAKSSYEVRPVLPSGERAGSMQARADEQVGTVGEQQAIAKREAEHPLITLAGKPGALAQKGAQFGKEAGANIIPVSDLLAEDVGLGNGHPVTEEQARAQSPRLTGALEGAGETVGGIVADPTNWALALSGAEAGPVLEKVASAVFTAKMGKDTYEGTKSLVANWDNLTPEERSEEITKLGISAIFTEEAGRHATKGASELIPAGKRVVGATTRIADDYVIGPAVRGAVKTAMPRVAAPFIEEHLHAPQFFREAGAEPAETAERKFANDVTVARIVLDNAEKKVNDAINAGVTPTDAEVTAFDNAKKRFTDVVEKQGAAQELIPHQKSERAFQKKLSDYNAGKEITIPLRDVFGKQIHTDIPSEYVIRHGTPDVALTARHVNEALNSDTNGRFAGVTHPRNTPRGGEDFLRSTSPLIEIPTKSITARPGIRPIVEPEVDTTGKALSKSGSSPPADLIPPTPEAAQPAGFGRIGKRTPVSEATPAELIPEAQTTAKAAPEAEAFNQSKPIEKPVGLRKEGAELSPEALEAQPAVRQKVFELGNEDLDKLARAHGIDPSEPQYSRAKEMRSEGRHQTGRQKLADDIVATIGDAEMQNLGRSAEGLKDNPDMASKAVKERAKSIFPRLRGPVDESGNPLSLEGMSPRELHQNLGFGERNVGVTKEEFEAAKKSFNDKASRSNAGLDPTMLVDAAKVAAYYFEGGVREFSAFSKQMVLKLGEAIRPHLEELYARAKANVAPTWKGTAEEWTAARRDIETRAARSRRTEGPRLPEVIGGPAAGEVPEYAGKLTASKMERYTDPNGQFYKTVLRELQKTTTPEAARDLAQDVMADFTESVKEGKFKLPEHTSEEGRVTNNLKSIAHNKAADWADQVSGETKGGTPRKVIETKRLSETPSPKKGSTGFPKLAETAGEDEEVSPSRPEESKSPYGFGEEPFQRGSDLHNAQRALHSYLEEHPETAAEDKELLLSASKRSLEKAEAARSKAYDAELAKSNDVEKAIEAGRKAEARVNYNKFTATDRYFGLTDSEYTKLGQAQRLTGPKFRARLTAIMDDLNRRAETGVERPRTSPPRYEGQSGYTNFLSGEGPARTGFGRITTEKAPTVPKPTETLGDAEGFSHGTEKTTTGEEREDLGAGQTLPLIPPTEAELTGRFSNIVDATRRPSIEPERSLEGRGGKVGFTPIDLEGAEANRVRLANLRVSEAEQALSEATTPAAQRTARLELEDAKDRLNYLKALKQPVSGGSQASSSLAKIADDYLSELQSKGHDVSAELEPLIPEAHSVIRGVQDEAARFNDYLKGKGFENPRNVQHGGMGGDTSALSRIQVGGPTELIPSTSKAATSAEVEAAAKRALAPRIGDENRAARSNEERDYTNLQSVRKSAGLKPSFSPISDEATATLGKQKPQTSGADVERLRTRSGTSYDFVERGIGEGNTVKHEVRGVDSTSKTVTMVSALSDLSDPNMWTVRGSFASPSGTEVGYEAYSRLLREAQRFSDKTGRLTTVKADPDVFSAAAKRTWEKLGKEFPGMEWKGKGEHARPQVTFAPSKAEIPYSRSVSTTTPLPRIFGGGEEPTGFMGQVLNRMNK